MSDPPTVQVQQVRRGVQAEQEVAVRVARGGRAGEQDEEEPAPSYEPAGPGTTQKLTL